MFILFIINLCLLALIVIMYNKSKKNHKNIMSNLFQLQQNTQPNEKPVADYPILLNYKSLQPNMTKYDQILSEQGERRDINRTDLFPQTDNNIFHQDRYSFALPYVKDKEVLDVASGTGYGANELYRLGLCKSVSGLELDEASVLYAKEAYASQGEINFNCGSILEMPFSDNSFDVVTSFETIEHVPNEAGQLSEIKRVLRSGGVYIVSTPNQWGIEGHPYHVKDYDDQILSDALTNNGFTILGKYIQYRSGMSKHYGIFPLTDANKNDTVTCLLYVATPNK